MSSSKSKNLSRRGFLKLCSSIAVAKLGSLACTPSSLLTSTPAPTAPVTESNRSVARDHIHLVCYPEIEDFDLLMQLGINTVLVELDANGDDWQTTYEAAIRHRLRIIPMIWDQDAGQSIWRWDEASNEWQLDRDRYPESRGAAFLGFLKDHPRYFAQTFAIYSFHEPLWQPEQTSPERMKAFYRQITEEVFPEGVYVYGEDITMGWEQSDECLTGVLDFESHNVYPFVNTPQGRYRPFDVIGNHYGPPTDDRTATIQAELACLDERIRRYASAPPARTGRRPKPIVLIQTFTDRDYSDLWNRMPSTEEMIEFASAFLGERKEQLKGLGWYCYRQASDNYLAWLHKDRFDDSNVDRLEALRVVSKRFLLSRRLFLPLLQAASASEQPFAG